MPRAPAPIPPRADLATALSEGLAALASARPGRVVGLEGPAGAGKSRLARTLLASLPYRGATIRAAAPAGDVARALPRGPVPGWAASVLARAERGGRCEPAALSEALAAALAAVAPFALVVEDLHELPGAGPWRDLADAVLRSRGLVLVVTGRSALASLLPAGAAVHVLAPLADEETTALLEAEAGAVLPVGATRWIARRAAGNPLFALEHFRFLARRGNLWSDGSRWRWREPEADRVPTSLEALVSERLRAATRSEDHREALDARALLGDDAPPDLWRDVAALPADRLADIEHEFRRAGILHGPDFAHPLFREGALAAVSPEARRRLARRALAVLEDRPALAASYVEPADLPPRATRDRLVAASRALLDRGDPEGAARLLARASVHARGEDRARLAREAARRLRPYDLRLARELAEGLVAGSPGDVEATLLLVEILVLLGEGRAADDLLGRLPAGEEARLRHWRTTVIAKTEAGAYAAAVALWRQHPRRHAAADATLVRAVAFALLHGGAFGEAEGLVLPFLARADLEGGERARLLHVLAGVRFHQGAHEEAVRRWDEAIALLDGGEDVHLLGRALGNRAAALRALHRLDEATEAVEDALAHFERLGAGRDHARQLHTHAGLLRQRGAFDAAEEELLDCRASFERSGDLPYLVACDVDLVVLYLDASPPCAGELALRFARSALDNARRLDSAPMTTQALRMASRAEARHGDPERALELVDEAIATARATGQEGAVANGVWSRGHVLEALGRTDEALAAFREAVAMHEAAGRTVQAAMDALEVDRLTGDRAGARERSRILREHGSHEGLRRLERAFPGLEAPAPPLPPAVVLRVLGSFAIERDGEPVTYRARKGEGLLVRLLEARLEGREDVPQLELQDALYPGTDEARAAAALQQLVYRIRTALGAEALLRTSRGYALGAVTSDAEAFLRSGETTLWRGPYGADTGAGEARARLSRALHERAADLVAPDPAEARRLADLLVASDPYDLQALRLALRAAPDAAAARRAYEAGRARLAEVGERLPDDPDAFLRA